MAGPPAELLHGDGLTAAALDKPEHRSAVPLERLELGVQLALRLDASAGPVVEPLDEGDDIVDSGLSGLEVPAFLPHADELEDALAVLVLERGAIKGVLCFLKDLVPVLSEATF